MVSVAANSCHLLGVKMKTELEEHAFRAVWMCDNGLFHSLRNMKFWAWDHTHMHIYIDISTSDRNLIETPQNTGASLS